MPIFLLVAPAFLVGWGASDAPAVLGAQLCCRQRVLFPSPAEAAIYIPAWPSPIQETETSHSTS